MLAKTKDRTRRPRGGAHQASTLPSCFPCSSRMQRAVTQRHSIAAERPALRLRHQDGGKNELYDSPGTPQVLRELMTWFVVDR